MSAPGLLEPVRRRDLALRAEVASSWAMYFRAERSGWEPRSAWSCARLHHAELDVDTSGMSKYARNAWNEWAAEGDSLDESMCRLSSAVTSGDSLSRSRLRRLAACELWSRRHFERRIGALGGRRTVRGVWFFCHHVLPTIRAHQRACWRAFVCAAETLLTDLRVPLHFDARPFWQQSEREVASHWRSLGSDGFSSAPADYKFAEHHQYGPTGLPRQTAYYIDPDTLELGHNPSEVPFDDSKYSWFCLNRPALR